MPAKIFKQNRRKFDSAFKEGVLKMVASGRPISEISKALGIGDNLIYRWKKNSGLTGKKNHTDNGSSSLSGDLFVELERAKSELRRTEQERDILKKALRIFSRGI